MENSETKPALPIENQIGQRESGLRRFAGQPFARQVIKFGLTTGLSACLSLGLPIILVELFDFAQRHAVLIGFACAYLFNVIVLRSFVFESKSHWLRDLAAYVATSGALRVIEYGAFIVLAEWVGLHYAAALIIVLTAATITKFFTYRFVFR